MLMSALGQKRTFAVQTAMSALPPKADMRSAKRDVRFAPESGHSSVYVALSDEGLACDQAGPSVQ